MKTATNLRGYVSQKKWKESEPEVECTVEAIVGGVRVRTVIMCIDPFIAVEKFRKNPDKYTWTEIKEE